MNPSLVAFATVARKEITRILRIWPQTILPPVITMTLYFIIFGRFIGSQLAAIDGFSYMEFIVPGVVMMAVITNAYLNVTSSFFSSKFQRSIEELLVSPAPASVIVFGYVTGGMMRGLLVGAIVTLVARCFTPLHLHSAFFILAYVALTAFVFSLAGLTNGIFAKKFDDISIIPTFVITPLSYLGGVFYSIALLPPVWRAASRLNPIIYMVNGFRYGFLGISDINVWGGLAMLLLFAGALLAVNLHLLKKGVGLRT